MTAFNPMIAATLRFDLVLTFLGFALEVGVRRVGELMGGEFSMSLSFAIDFTESGEVNIYLYTCQDRYQMRRGTENMDYLQEKNVGEQMGLRILRVKFAKRVEASPPAISSDLIVGIPFSDGSANTGERVSDIR